MDPEPRRARLRDIVRSNDQAWDVSVKSDGHAFNKTMLAKFGFADDDRRSELHDYACRFLVQPDVAAKLATAFFPDVAKQVPCESQMTCDSPACLTKAPWGDDFSPRDWPARWQERFTGFSLHRARNEMLLSKGEGQYQTTIGFVDVVLQVHPAYEVVEIPHCPGCGAPAQGFEKHRPRANCYGIALEVKAGRTQISEAVRQIGLYRQYLHLGYGLPGSIWGLATPWEITEPEGALLAQERIKHVLLGEAFARFVEGMRSPPSATSDVTL
jgi:hypothetical protein